MSSNRDYCLVLEDGGSSLFDFTERAHSFLQHGQLSLAEWHGMVKLIWKQMVECIEYIHSNNICHFDVSLGSLPFFVSVPIYFASPIHRKLADIGGRDPSDR